MNNRTKEATTTMAHKSLLKQQLSSFARTLISLSILLFAALALVIPSDEAFGQTLPETLDYESISYNPDSKQLIIVFDEDIDGSTVNFDGFDIVAEPMSGGTRNFNFLPEPATVVSVNGATLTIQLARFQYSPLDNTIGNPDFPIAS